MLQNLFPCYRVVEALTGLAVLPTTIHHGNFRGYRQEVAMMWRFETRRESAMYQVIVDSRGHITYREIGSQFPTTSQTWKSWVRSCLEDPSYHLCPPEDLDPSHFLIVAAWRGIDLP